MPAKRSAPKEIIQVKVTLKGIDPPIWRRVLVARDITLGELHNVIQIVMGWEEAHLHQFIIKGEYYGPDTGDGWDETLDEETLTLDEAAPRANTKILYEYDFGDSWIHEIRVEKRLPREPGTHYPICLAGERHGPPEDCGGVYGYATFLEARADPSHPQHEDMSEWFEDEFDPEAFDLESINRDLKEYA